MHHRALRILHAIHSLSGGGAERQLQLLCRFSDGDMAQHAVFCVNETGNKMPREKVKIFRSASSDPRSRAYLRSLRSAIRDFAPTIVHAWQPASIAIPAMICGAMAGCRIVFSYRTRMRFHRPLSYPQFAVALACADRIVSNNPIVNSTHPFRWLFRFKSGAVIYNAVESPGTPRSGPFPIGREWRLACVGRLTAAKNLFTVIEAVSSLAHSPPWRLDIYGEGELRDALNKAITARRLEDRVTLQGFRADVEYRLAASDLLIMPSLWEGMPNVALEALALGVPVVLSDIPAHRELFRDEGLVQWVNPSRPDELAQVIADCMTGRVDLEQMAHQGPAFAAAFTPARLAAEYQTFYEEIAG